MEFVIDSLHNDWQSFLGFSPRLIYASLLLAGFWIGGRIVATVLGRVLRRGRSSAVNMVFAQKLVMWALRFAGVLLALGVMGFQGVAASLLATGGVLAIVLGFAFKEIGENLLAGIFLAFSRPFELGDLIKTGDLTGTVKSIDIRSVHIRTADACDVYAPNAQIFSQELYNYTRDGLRRPAFTIGVAYHDEPEQVIALLERATQAVNDVLKVPTAFVSIQAFATNHIEYQVFFYMDTNHSKRNIVELTNDVMVSCWRALREAGMTFSTDVTTSLDLRSTPVFRMEGLPQQKDQ
ncbi:MAG: mechanosensitive ion channel [Lysobacterales bacterium]